MSKDNRNLAIVDLDTSEIISKYQIREQRKNNNYFTLVFSREFITRGIELTNFISLLACEMNSSDNILQLTTKRKQQLSKELRMSPNTFHVYLSRSCKQNIMIRLARSLYMINPYLLTKSSKDKLIELKALYNKIGAEQRELSFKVKEDSKRDFDRKSRSIVKEVNKIIKV